MQSFQSFASVLRYTKCFSDVDKIALLLKLQKSPPGIGLMNQYPQPKTQRIYIPPIWGPISGHLKKNGQNFKILKKNVENASTLRPKCVEYIFLSFRL